MESRKSVWEEKLAEARKKREAERGTSKTTNPLMEDFKKRMEKREMQKAKEDLKTAKKEARKGGNKYGAAAMKAGGTSKNFQQGGYSTETKPDGSKYQDAPISKANLQKYKDAQQKKKDKATKAEAPKRRPTGREEMIAQRYMDNEKRKKEGGSSVVGS
jgi:hypothetical protein